MYSDKTRTKIHYLFKRRRLYERKRSMFKKYVQRFPASYPAMMGHSSLILNTEELATIFHFPTKAADLPPGVPRVVVRKKAPFGLPIE